ncbi:hypothetical protein CKA32_005942 [Geitlerinema sp. FC II]|nr:hypothetical protein CKA32_005942 [Geitlerinema sp. FC II]
MQLNRISACLRVLFLLECQPASISKSEHSIAHGMVTVFRSTFFKQHC